MRKATLALAITTLIAISSHPAMANMLLRQIDRTGLTQQDLDIMVQTGGALYATSTARAGNDTIWSNPETGAHGSIKVDSVAGDCVGLTYKFSTRRQPKIHTVETRRCLQDGRWILTP